MSPSRVLLQGLNIWKALACGNQSLNEWELLSLWGVLCSEPWAESKEGVPSSLSSRGLLRRVGDTHSEAPFTVHGGFSGLRPPGLAGVGSPRAGVWSGTSKAHVASSCLATCPDGWEGLSSALNYPGRGFLIFLLIRSSVWLPGSQEHRNRAAGDEGIS